MLVFAYASVRVIDWSNLRGGRLKRKLLRLRLCGSLCLVGARPDIAVRPFITILTFTDSAAGNFHKVVLRRVRHTLEATVRASKASQAHA